MHITLPVRTPSCARVAEVPQLNATKKITVNIAPYTVTQTNEATQVSIFGFESMP